MPSKRLDRGTWEGQVRWRGRKYRAQFPSRRAAADWESQKRRELEEQEKTPKPIGMDFLTFSNKYLDYAEMHFTRKVFKEKKALTKRLIARWGNPGVDEITTAMLNEYLAEQAQKRSPNAHNKDRKNLLAMWNFGRDILDLPSNPVARIKKLPHDREPQYTPPTLDILKVLAAAEPDEKVFLQAYLHTGARRSEIFRWTWIEDVNFERREIRLGTRKTRDGSMQYDWLPMNDELYESLWWWWNRRPIKDSPYVFPSTRKAPGSHYGGQYVERRWFLKTLCKRAKVKYFGFHALRRYVASVLADTHKVSAKTIQRVLRHRKLETTERYIHNINRDLAAIMNMLAEKSPPSEPTKNEEGAKRET
jgi:integrase